MTNIQAYKASVTWFCCYMAELQRFADMVEKGEMPSRRKVIYASSMAQQYAPEVLKNKEALGFTDGFSFLEDNRFDGFSILNGRLEGDRDKILPLVRKWVEGFPGTANNYEYEVGIYALALGWSEEKKGLYPADLETRPRRSAVKPPAADDAA